jgi:hypothetical protein
MARRARFINPILYSLDSPSGFHRDELRIYLKDVRDEWNISNFSMIPGAHEPQISKMAGSSVMLTDKGSARLDQTWRPARGQ